MERLRVPSPGVLGLGLQLRPVLAGRVEVGQVLLDLGEEAIRQQVGERLAVRRGDAQGDRGGSGPSRRCADGAAGAGVR